MNSEQFNPRFWNSVGIVYAIAAVVILITIFGFWANNSNDVHVLRFKYDFFATLAGQEMKYGRQDAKEFSEMFLAMPEDKFEEQLDEFMALRNAHLDGSLGSLKDSLILNSPGDLSEYDRITGYVRMIHEYAVEDRDEVVHDTREMMIILNVLKGGEPPEIEGADRDIVPPFSRWLPWILLAAQFVAFGIYAIAARFGRQLNDGYNRPENYNPLSLPPGIGSKISVAFTLPGSLPLIVLIMVLTVMSQAVSSRMSKGGGSSAFRVGSDEEPSENLQRSLERIRAKVEGA